MKLTALIILTGFIQVSALSYSQNTKFNFELKNQSVRTVLQEIEKNSQYRFFYSENLAKLDDPVNLSVKEKDISGVLNELFYNTRITYEIMENNLIALLPVLAQQPRSLGGKVTDRSGAALPGVTVVVKGTTAGVVTDANGNYSIGNLPERPVLVFSFVGMKSQEVEVGTQTTLNIVMQDETIGIDEVVAIGYGTMRKSDLTGAISKVSGADLAESLAPNLIAQAQGKLAGVDIVNQNGSPGAGATIRIRGNRSINASNDPLFVIDGIPSTQNINDFNPRDIESVEVLKDASAVAIYGSRGANGVILITTKRGKEGKTIIESNNYYGYKTPFENLDLMNGKQFAEYVRVANGLSKSDTSRDGVILGDVMKSNLEKGIETNWLDLIVQEGMQQEHQVSARGGGNAVNYYLSGSYYLEEGVIKASDYERYSIRSNLDGKISDKIKLGLSLTASSDLRNQMSNSPMTSAISYVPLLVPYDSDGKIIPYPNPVEGLLPSPLLNYAPDQYVDESKGYRFFSNIFGEYDITTNLTYRINFGTDFKSSRRGQFRGNYDGSSSTGSINNLTFFAYTLENIITYTKDLNDHSISAVGLFSTQKERTEVSSLNGRNIPIIRSSFYDLGSSAEITGIGSGLTDWGLLSYMARLNYRFKNKYLLSVSGRSDGSSRLAKGHKWAFFPSVSAGWIISEEDFLKLPFISFLKVRAGYGKVGNTAIQPYQTLGGLSRTTYAFGNEGAFGFGHSKIANPELGWEVSKTMNLGLDFGLADGRLNGTLEYYDTQTEDLLLERLLPITSGFNSVLENVGSTRNRGVEFSLSYNIMNRRDGLNWDIDLNVFSNKEEIVKLFQGTVDDVGNRWFIGSPVNVFYDYKFNGIWQSNEAEEAAKGGQKPGDVKIADVNGRDVSGFLTKAPDGKINTDDRTILGSTVPDWSGGINNRLTYKGFNFLLQIYTRQGQMLNSSLHELTGNNWEGRRSRLNFNYWTPENPSNEIPIPRAGGTPLYASSIEYFDGSFIKVKNITFGYDFAEKFLKSGIISSLQLYVSALNPLTIAKYDFVDPESSNGNVGVDSQLSSSTYIIGLNLKF